MAYVRPNRVRETSTTTGTGDITLAGAVTGWRAFSSSMSVGDTFPYVIEGRDASGAQTAEWETGVGTWGATGKLERTTVMASSNAGNLVVFASASLVAYVGLNAEACDTIADERAATSMAAHVAAADPHTGYVLETREGVANGIATLDANAILPTDQSGFPAFRYASAAEHYGLPGVNLVQHVQAGATLAVTPDNRMIVTPFVAIADVTINAISLTPATPSAAGGQAQVALYAATIDANGLFVVGALIENFGTVAIDSYGQKKITGLTRAIKRGMPYAFCVACSKAVTLNGPRYLLIGDQDWGGVNLGNLGSYHYVDAAYPPPASIGAIPSEAGGTAQFLIPVATMQWVPT